MRIYSALAVVPGDFKPHAELVARRLMEAGHKLAIVMDEAKRLAIVTGYDSNRWMTIEECGRSGLNAGDLSPASYPARIYGRAPRAVVQEPLPGVRPVTLREKLESLAGAPLRGGDRAPPAGGLFDEAARRQVELF